MKRTLLTETGLFAEQDFAIRTFSPSGMYFMGKEGVGTPYYEPDPQTDSVEARAKAAGVDPLEMIYDALVEGETFWHPITGYAPMDGGSLSMTRDFLLHPNTVIGLGDGGAHLNFLQESGTPTFMLTHWARDRKAGPQFPLEEKL